MAQQRRANGKPHGDTYKPLWRAYGTYESSAGSAWLAR